jgi:hypothetical protein
VAGAAALGVTALSVALATTAQATHSGSPAPGPGVSRVIVESGQSLWSLAGEYDPHADPRTVVDRILRLNSMTDTRVQAGAVLWVPRTPARHDGAGATRRPGCWYARRACLFRFHRCLRLPRGAVLDYGEPQHLVVTAMWFF